MADNLPDVYLRFVDADAKPVIPGDSMDAAYPGTQGWLGITEFNFGFGWGGSDSVAKNDTVAKKLTAGKPLTQREADQVLTPKESPKAGKGGKSGAKPEKKEGTLQPERFTFSRNPSPASIHLLKKLREGGDPIPQAQVILCRPAAVATVKYPIDAKIPFLQFFLEEVHLLDCKVQISKDSAPSESMEFKFQKVTMKTVWTDNATGTREPGLDLSVSFDFDATKGKVSWSDAEI